ARAGRPDRDAAAARAEPEARGERAREPREAQEERLPRVERGIAGLGFGGGGQGQRFHGGPRRECGARGAKGPWSRWIRRAFGTPERTVTRLHHGSGRERVPNVP